MALEDDRFTGVQVDAGKIPPAARLAIFCCSFRPP